MASTPSDFNKLKQCPIVCLGSGKCSSTSKRQMTSSDAGEIACFSIIPQNTGTSNVLLENSTSHGLRSSPLASKPTRCIIATNPPCAEPSSSERPGGSLYLRIVRNQ